MGVFQALFVLINAIILVHGRLCPEPICPPDLTGNRSLLLPSQDCKTFFSCVMGFPTLLACPPGLSFSESTPGCIPDDMTDCSECEESEVKENIEEVGDKEEEKAEMDNDIFQLLNYFKMPYN